MGSLPLRQIEHDLIDITPAPAFRRIVTFNHRMLRGMEMFCGVLVRRGIAATDMAAGPADPQMDPHVTGFQTFLAAERARRNILNLRDVLAWHGHGLSADEAQSMQASR